MDGARTILEVGCYNGAFLSEIAAKNQKFHFIGIDRKFKRISKASKNIEKAGLLNVLILRAQAQNLVDFFKPNTLDEIWIFFPDPWPKRAQQKHRLLQEPFFINAAKTLKPKGTIHIKTDHEGYFQSIMKLCLKLEPLYQICHQSTNYWKDIKRIHSMDAPLFCEHQTLFEKRFIAQELPIYYLQLKCR